MRIEYLVLLGLWATFYTYWLVSARRAKRDVGSNRKYLRYRVFFIAVLILLVYGVRGFRRIAIARPGPAFGVGGLAICALGFSLAVWARIHLGRNWGMPMSVKEDPEMVTTGPYRRIRHPIYSGLLLAMLGSALLGGAIWLIVFVFFGTFFVFSARAEERLMLRQFPERYAAYRARTNAMVPFVW